MERARIISVHEDSWGKATIFAPEEEEAQEVTTSQLKMKNQSLAKVQSLAIIDKHIYEQLELELDLRPMEFNSDGTGLSYFQASLIETVLEDTIIQLRILVECNNEMRVEKVLSDYPLLRALKYGVVQPVIVDELVGINPYDLDKLEYKLNKLDADRNYQMDRFIKLYVSLSTESSFKILCDSVFEIIDKERRYHQLIEEEAKNRLLKRELAKQLRQQRIHHKTQEYDANVLVDTLKTAIEDADLLFEITKRYIGNWQGARTECHQQIIDQNEGFYVDSTEFYKRRNDHEHRVHSEVELLTNILINETLQKVEEWMNKYEQDMEAIDLKTQIKRNEYQEMHEKRIYLDDMYATHARQIKDWLKFKVDRAKAREYSDTMTKSAITVQAWWRGLLVRKQLGPYRVKKKRPPKLKY